MVKVGKIYKHFKGNRYIVKAIARHSETNEEMVVYSSVDNEDVVWVRPISMWNEIVDEKNNIKRFELE